MKKKTLVLAACLVVAIAAAAYALAAGGDASDPLASLSYLTGAFSSSVDVQVDEKLDASDAALLGSMDGASGSSAADLTSWTETRLKSGDVLTGSTGTSVLVLAGGVDATFSGTVVDVSTGTAISSGSALTAGHRYLVAEDTTASFTVSSKTAVVDYQGPSSFTYSSAVDYNAIAGALKALHLFQGSLTGYGQGYDLEKAPTRLQALIMFIRVLGEEDAALAWSGSSPFTDVAAGTQAAQYVGYAYEKGYTNGFTATLFQPAQTITVEQYMEFILRALGYSTAANTDLTSTLDNAVSCNVISAGERSMLAAAAPFLRAELVYISYYALDAQMADTGLLLSDMLQQKGVFTFSELTAAQAMVPGGRL